jgi:hypothetical protein
LVWLQLILVRLFYLDLPSRLVKEVYNLLCYGQKQSDTGVRGARLFSKLRLALVFRYVGRFFFSFSLITNLRLDFHM